MPCIHLDLLLVNSLDVVIYVNTLVNSLFNDEGVNCVNSFYFDLVGASASNVSQCDPLACLNLNAAVASI